MSSENKTIIFKKSNLVAKSNYIIEATYKLGVTEQKVIAAIASNIRPTDEDFKTYTFSIKEFTELIGSKSKNMYLEMEKIVKNLMQPFNFINQEGKLTTIAWLSKATYNTGEGTVTLRFDPDLKPFFLLLNEKFTRYKLGNIIHLRSSYSIRVYELLKSYQGLTERTFSLDDLKSKLGVDDKYPRWINFRQRVLDHAQKELEEKTDIIFSYETIKKGRSIDKVKFKIKSNPKINEVFSGVTNKLDKVVVNDDVMEIQELGMKIGLKLSKKQVTEWLQYGKENIIQLLDKINYREDIKSKIGYINSVLPKLNKVESEKDITIEDKIQIAIRQLVSDHTPKRGLKKVDILPDWLIEEAAMQLFEELMSKEKAKSIWVEKREEIVKEINERRKKVLTT